MSYAQRFQLAKQSLITFCRERISENWEQMFDMWLSCEGHMVFGEGYQDIFEEHFGDYITEEVNRQLWFAGKNIVYAISSCNKVQLNELLDFVEDFVSTQLDDFDNAYDTSEWVDDEGDLIQKTKGDNST